jgi:hypothetical protein
MIRPRTEQSPVIRSMYSNVEQHGAGKTQTLNSYVGIAEENSRVSKAQTPHVEQATRISNRHSDSLEMISSSRLLYQLQLHITISLPKKTIDPNK